MGKTDIKVKIKKCTHLEGSSMLPGWSSDPYVIVKLCEKKEECAAAHGRGPRGRHHCSS